MYEDRYQTGNRDAWEFEWPGKALEPSTSQRLEYHRGRQRYWDEQAAGTETEIRAKGVSLQERSVTGGVRFEATVDAALGSRLGEQRQKSDRHRNVAEQLEGFVSEFQRTPDRVFKLKLADLKFFGIVGEITKFGDEELA
jgi:hypothetical protein